MKKSFYIIIFIFFFFSGCKEIKKNNNYKTYGYFVGKNIYEVVAYGSAPDNLNNKIKQRNMAKEAALISAQLYIQNNLNLNYRFGLIYKTEYFNDKYCKLIYRVNINTNK